MTNDSDKRVKKALEAATGWTSGKQLSLDLGLHHSTINRAVAKLRSQGTPVESKVGHGYRLAAPVQEVKKPPPKKARPRPKRTKPAVATSLTAPRATAKVSRPDTASLPMPQPHRARPRMSAYPQAVMILGKKAWQLLTGRKAALASQPGPAQLPDASAHQPAHPRFRKNLWFQASLMLLLAVLVIPAWAVNMGAEQPGGAMNPFRGGAGQEAPAEQSTPPIGKSSQGPRVAPEIANLQRDPAPSTPPAEPSAQSATAPKEAAGPTAAPAQADSKADTNPQPDAVAKALLERDEYKNRVSRLEKEVAKLGSLLLAKKQDGQPDAEGQHSKRKSKKSKKDKAKETAAAKVEASPPPPVQPQKSDVRSVNVRSVVMADGGQWTARLELERSNGQTSQRVVRVGDVVAGMSVHDIAWNSVVLTGDSGRQTVLRVD